MTSNVALERSALNATNLTDILPSSLYCGKCYDANKPLVCKDLESCQGTLTGIKGLVDGWVYDQALHARGGSDRFYPGYSEGLYYPNAYVPIGYKTKDVKKIDWVNAYYILADVDHMLLRSSCYGKLIDETTSTLKNNINDSVLEQAIKCCLGEYTAAAQIVDCGVLWRGKNATGKNNFCETLLKAYVLSPDATLDLTVKCLLAMHDEPTAQLLKDICASKSTDWNTVCGCFYPSDDPEYKRLTDALRTRMQNLPEELFGLVATRPACFYQPCQDSIFFKQSKDMCVTKGNLVPGLNVKICNQQFELNAGEIAESDVVVKQVCKFAADGQNEEDTDDEDTSTFLSRNRIALFVGVLLILLLLGLYAYYSTDKGSATDVTPTVPVEELLLDTEE